MRFKKIRSKVLIFLSILMFFVISSLTPTVADWPEYKAYGSTADTVYDTTPSAYASCPGYKMETYNGPGDVVFKVNYTFENNHASDGSYHMAILIVVRTAPSPDDFHTDTGWVFVAPGNSESDKLTVSDYVASSVGYSYDIEVQCRVKENIEDETYTSNSDFYTWEV